MFKPLESVILIFAPYHSLPWLSLGLLSVFYIALCRIVFCYISFHLLFYTPLILLSGFLRLCSLNFFSSLLPPSAFPFTLIFEPVFSLWLLIWTQNVVFLYQPLQHELAPLHPSSRWASTFTVFASLPIAFLAADLAPFAVLTKFASPVLPLPLISLAILRAPRLLGALLCT